MLIHLIYKQSTEKVIYIPHIFNRDDKKARNVENDKLNV
jgi:hypothetical protein